MPYTNEPIAVVGSAGRFPGGCNTPSKLWNLLKNPKDVLRKVPKERFNVDAFYHPDPLHHGTTNVTQSYFLDEDVAHFDASFFNIPPKEAEAIDPQQRILLETVYDSLCTAGLPIEKLRGSQTAVYVGLMCDDWSTMIQQDLDVIPSYTGTGVARSIMSNRISYFFDWHGPSMTIDTACSSSLVAVHEAVRVLRSGDSKVAIAAGSNLILSPGQYVAESKLRMLSPTGRCRMWDASADGYGRGEGVAAVVLKTLSQAIHDGDQIECIIRETGVNQDGRTSGLTVPSNEAQSRLIRDTYARAGLDIHRASDRPQFFHAHGTGTKAGDPQEARAINDTFFSGEDAKLDKLRVGSIKTIIGHTEGTAGLASLIGTSLALRNRIIPPNMHFNSLNPDIVPFYSRLHVPVAPEPWTAGTDGVRRASVNSFGFGGTNAHAILEEYVPEKQTRIADSSITYTPLIFSANSAASLSSMMSDMLDHIRMTPKLAVADLIWTLQHRRSTLPYRAAIAGADLEQLIENLETAIESSTLDVRYISKRQPQVLGIFTGQGAQWPRMGAQLIESSPFAAERIADLDRSLATLPVGDRPEWTLKEQLLAASASSRITEAALSQPLCTAVQVILVDLLQGAGVKLGAVVGHSSGEIGAAYAAGLISSHDAIRVAYYRGFHAKLAASPSGGKGSMAAVGLSFEEAQAFCQREDMKNHISVAAHNSASGVTISGDETHILQAVSILKEDQKFARQLKVDTAYHSAHMLPCAGLYKQSLDQLHITSPEPKEGLPAFISSVVEGEVMDGSSLTSQYWVDNMVQPVLFAGVVEAAAAYLDTIDLVVELGPHPALKGPASDNLDAAGMPQIPYTGLLARNNDDVVELSSALGFVWKNLGAGSIDFEGFERLISGHDNPRTVLSDLPSYPYSHQTRYWAEPRVSNMTNNLQLPPHPLLGRPSVVASTSSSRQWKNILRPFEISWLQGHKLQNQIVFPASGYVAMAIEACQLLAEEAKVVQYHIKDLVLERAISFMDENASIEVIFSLNIRRSDAESMSVDFACHSSPEGEHASIKNASGSVDFTLGEPSSDALPFVQPTTVHSNMFEVGIDRFYSALSKIGYQYSHPFHGMAQIKRKLGVAMGEMTDQSENDWEDQLVVHPGMLDTALQTLFAAFCYPGDESLRALHVPVKIESLRVNPYFTLAGQGKQITVPWEATHRDEEKSHILADVQLFSEDGKHSFVQIEGVSLKPFFPFREQDDTTLFTNFVYNPVELDGEAAASNDKLGPEEVRVARDMERIAFFYLRQLSLIPAAEREEALSHHRHLMAWADYTVEKVAQGNHDCIDKECLQDTLADIVSLTDQYRDRVDALLIESTGQNLPDVVRNRAGILEHMTKDGLLNRFYEDSIGLSTANWWMARMVKQLSHRYSELNILEIGAGTGGATRAVLPTLGNSFASYTYTDVSTGFFEAAEDKFKDFAGRMIFKAFDMVKSPQQQGFLEGSYDLILASNVLHVSEDLDLMMSNVRRLLKPGGYLINLETVTNDMLRNGIIMGGLPGWWIGAESGRPHGPMLTLDQWDALLKRQSFSGIETSTPIYDSVHAVAVWASQAIDDNVKALREPSVAAISSSLVVLGGHSLPAFELTETVTAALEPKFAAFKHMSSIEELLSDGLEPDTTILSLVDLDEPVMKSLTAAKLEALQYLFNNARNILWVTKGARCEDPYAYMIYGVGRVVKFEQPNVNMQLLDVDNLEIETGQYIADALIRHQLLDDFRMSSDEDDLFLWSSEPEVFLENGRTLVPRLYPNIPQNQRVNSAQRPIFRNIDPSTTSLRLVPVGDALELQEITALSAAAMDLQQAPLIRVEQSLLQAVPVANVGSFMLCVGTDIDDPKKRVLALTTTAGSPCPVAAGCSVPIPASQQFGKVALMSVGAYLLAQSVVSIAIAGTSLLVHESDQLVKTAIWNVARQAKVKAIFTTCDRQKEGSDCKLVHPALPSRILRQSLPGDVSACVNLAAPGTLSAEVGKTIANLAPAYAVIADAGSLLGHTLYLRPGTTISEAEKALQQAWTRAKTSSLSADTTRMIKLKDVSKADLADTRLTMIDWIAPTVPVRVKPVDEHNIFRGDKTYLLIGLSGEVGQSLCSWMVSRGARHIVLTSRNPCVDSGFISSLADKGANVRAMPLDITSRSSLDRCLDEIKRSMPGIAGVANGALIVADAHFNKLDLEGMNKVLAPKVDGSLFLDDAFQDADLEWFIMFSSLTACLGNSGQSNYAASNMFMTSLALQRRNRGVAGSVIDLSSLMGIGHVGRSDTFDAEYFKSLGATSVSETDLHKMFAEAISVGKPGSTESCEIVTGMSPISKQDLEQTRVQYRKDLKFCHLTYEQSGNAGQANAAGTASVKTLLKEVKDLVQAKTVLLESFSARVKKIMQIPAEDVFDTNLALVEIGVDSLVALDIRSWFVRELNVDVPVLKILGGNSTQSLIEDAMGRIPATILDVKSLKPGSEPKASAPGKIPVIVAPEIDDSKKSEQSLPVTPALSTASKSSAYFNDDSSGDNGYSTDASSVNDNEVSKRDAIIESSDEVTEIMSFGQTRFWFLHHALQDKTTFNVAISISLKGRIQVDKFTSAIDAVARRHEALRTRYFWSGDNMDVATQGILSNPLVTLEHRQISHASEATEVLQQMRDYEWDLEDWESMKFTLLSMGNDQHWLICGTHHITLDGVSLNIIFADLEKAYLGQTLQAIPESSRYRSYAVQQRQRHEQGGFKNALDYYRKLIPTDTPPIPLLPFANVSVRTPQTSYACHRADIRLSPSETAKIKEVARQCHATNFHLYLAALQSLLFRLLPETNELFIGIADANRTNEDYLSTVGFFLNLLPLRFDRPSKHARFSSAVKNTRNRVYGALEFSDMPFDVLLDGLGITRSANAPPVFQVFVDYRQGTQERATLAGLDAAGEQWFHPRTGYDISLDLLENSAGDTLVTIQLQQSLYSQEHTELLARAYVNFLKELVKEPAKDVMIASPTVWDVVDIADATKLGSGRDYKYEWPETILHRIEDVTIADAGKTAVKDGKGNTLTYSELLQRANTIAEVLGDCEGKTIGVMQEPGADWVCSMLAVFQSGGCYLPLDLKNSTHRLASAVRATKPAIILVDPTTSASIDQIGAVDSQAIDVSKIVTSTSARVENYATADATAVVLFTSGSTGEPKGIRISHSNLVAQTEGASLQFDVDGGALSHVLQQSPLSFDFSLEQILLALCNGGCLHIASKEDRGDPQAITNLMSSEGITYTSATPSEYNTWFQYASENLLPCSQWKVALFGGEPFGIEFIRRFRDLNLSGLRVFNNYGPGETTISATANGEILYKDEESRRDLTVGHAAPNYAIYIVDEKLNMLPVGNVGEVVIGGAGVSKGYLDRPDDTRTKFLPNKFDVDGRFATLGWTQMYRTGDRGKLLPNGRLMIQGRIDGDTQIKLRGFRVELGEVEAAIIKASKGDLKSAVVTLKQDEEGEKFLAAHCVLANHSEDEAAQKLFDDLEAKLPLPCYMRPAAWMKIDALPLTAHNKVDRAAIQAMSLNTLARKDESAMARNLSSTESTLRDIWTSILPNGASRMIVPGTDFFHVGGSSLLLIKMQRMIKQSLGVAMKLNDLMNASQLETMASAIDSIKGSQIDWTAETAIPSSWQTDFATPLPNKSSSEASLTIFLTGATGYLGRHLIPTLSSSSKVGTIHCLVRSETDETHLRNLAAQPKVMIHVGDLALPNLGLPEALFSTLSSSVDVILHSGANRSFWDDYEVLRPVNTDAVKEVARLALPRRIPVHFMGSGSTRIYGGEAKGVYNTDAEKHLTGLEPPRDGSDGYVASKWAAERFLRNVMQEFGLDVTFHTPMPVPEYGPTAEHAQPEEDEMLAELVAITKAVGVRPVMEELKGWADIVPTQVVVEDICSALLGGSGGETRLITARRRIDWRRFIEVLKTDETLSSLPSMPTLLWIGVAKRSGYSYFMPAHRLEVMNDSEDFVSRR